MEASANEKIARAEYVESEVVTARRAQELEAAVTFLTERVHQAESLSDEELAQARHRLKVVSNLERDFKKRWGMAAPTGLLARYCCCSKLGVDETTEERLERIVRAKVRRDVRSISRRSRALA